MEMVQPAAEIHPAEKRCEKMETILEMVMEMALETAREMDLATETALVPAMEAEMAQAVVPEAEADGIMAARTDMRKIFPIMESWFLFRMV